MADKITGYPARLNTPVDSGSLLDVSENNNPGAGQFTTVKVPVEDIEFNYPAWHKIGDPGEPAFEPNWSNDPGGGSEAEAAFYKDQTGRVYLRGLVKLTDVTGAFFVKMFTLPVGYRPAYKVRFPIYFEMAAGALTSFGSSAPFTVQVDPNGDVMIMQHLGGAASPEKYDLNPVNFRTGS